MLLDYISNINKTIKIIFIVLIYIYILIEIFRLTIFTYDYMKSYHYGKELEKNCIGDTIEYETKRYQIYSNILKNLLDYYNESNNLFILIIIIIYGIILTLVITYIIYELINDLKNNNTIKTDIFSNICNLLILLTCIISISYIPLITGLKLDKYKNNYNEETINIILYIFIGFIILILILYYNYYDSNSEGEKINYSKLFILTVITIFIGVSYYIKYIIDMYIYNKTIYNNNIKNNIKYDNHLIKEDKNNNIFINYIIKSLGLKYYNNKIINSDFYNSEIFVFIIQLLIIILIIILITNRFKTLEKLYNKEINLNEFMKCITYQTNQTYCENFIYNNKEVNIIYNIYLKPFIYILILLIIINGTKNINENINKNIIIEPLIKYKYNINEIRKDFKYILDNNDDLRTSIKQNYANVILLVLYNDLFDGILNYKNYVKNMVSDSIDLTDNDKEEIINDIEKHIKELNIIPEFKYNNINNEKYIDYTKLKEYDINYYLNNKCKNESIFKNKNSLKQCSKYTKYIYTYIIKLIFLDNNLPTENQEKLENYQNIKNVIKNKIYKAINNVYDGKNYLGKKLTNNYEVNNKIKLLKEINSEEELNENIKNKDTLKKTIDKIIDIYISHIIAAQKEYKKINENTNIIKNNLENELNNHYVSEEKIKSFIKKYEKILKDKFDEINELLSNSHIKLDKKIENKIIENYNLYNNENIGELDYYKINNNSEEVNNNKDILKNAKNSSLLIIILVIIYILSYNLLKIT